MTVRKRGKRWHYDFMIRRVRYKGSIPEAQNKQEALHVEAEMRRAVYEGRYGRHLTNTTLEKFIKEVFLPYAKANRKKWEEDEQKCRIFFEFFKGKTFQEVAPMSIEQFKRWRRDSPSRYGRPRKASSLNQELAVLSRIFNMARENGYTNQNPLEKVRRFREAAPRNRYLSYEEEVRLREAMQDERYSHVLPLLDLALNTGMRLNEMLGLRWEEVDFNSYTINLPAKRKSTRTKTN